MEPKKNPRYDVHNKRNLIFNFSLALSLLIVISAFRIAVPHEKERTRLTDPIEPDVFIASVPVTEHKRESPLPVVKPKRDQIDLSRVKIVETPGVQTVNPGIDQNNLRVEDPFSGIEIPVETSEDTTTFIIVEHKPEPVGGFGALYKNLGEAIRYPKKAIRYHTTGTVFVEFVVEKNGEPGRIRIIRGIGNGCDEEAMRVIGLTRWNPGRQRGKPVKVKMVVPVVFKLLE